MASLSFSRRLANNFNWSINWTARMHQFALSFTVAERPRSQQHQACRSSYSTHAHYRPQYSKPQRYHRNFSTFSHRNQQASTTPPRSSQSSTSPKPSSSPPNNATTALNEPVQDISTSGFSDTPNSSPDPNKIDWTTSFHGLSTQPFPSETTDILLAPVDTADIEIKNDSLIYLPEIKYRRILNRAFGPGGWGLAPRGETIITSKLVTREYALVVHGRLVSIARGEQEYFDPEGIPTATEGAKSNALMRCCKDLGVASELWDPRFVRKFLREETREVWAEHVGTKKRKKVFVRKGDDVKYPYREVKG